MTVKSADKKPEKYIGPDGKPKIRMVPMDKNVTNEMAPVIGMAGRAIASKVVKTAVKKAAQSPQNEETILETLDMSDIDFDNYLKTLTYEELNQLEEGIIGGIAKGIGKGIGGAAKLAGKGIGGAAKGIGKAAHTVYVKPYTHGIPALAKHVVAPAAKLAGKHVVAPGAKLAGKGIHRAFVNKQGNMRLSTAGRADAAQAKLAKIKQRKKDLNRLNKAKAAIHKERNPTPAATPQMAHTTYENVNNVNEISKDLAGRYTKKRADDLPHAGYMMNDPHSSERRKKGVRDYVKMQKGIKTAVNKLTGKAMVPATEANMSDLSYDADIHSNGSMKVKKMGKDIHLHGKSYHSSDDHAKVAKKMGMKISSHGKTMGGTRSTLTKESVDEGYRSGHGSGSGTVHGGKHNDPAFQALMKKHGVTHKLVGPKNNKAAKLIGSPDNIRKVLQASYTEDSDAVKAFLAKGGKITKLPPGKAQGYHGKDDPGKHVHGMIAKDAAKNLKLRKHGKHLDTSTPVHKEGVEKVKAPVGQRPKGIGWSLHSSGQQTGKHDVWKRTTKKVAAPKFNKEEKGRGPTGIAYSVKKGHPDAENPSTRKKYPERQTPEYKKKFFGKVEKESVEMKTFFQLRESMKCH